MADSNNNNDNDNDNNNDIVIIIKDKHTHCATLLLIDVSSLLTLRNTHTHTHTHTHVSWSVICVMCRIRELNKYKTSISVCMMTNTWYVKVKQSQIRSDKFGPTYQVAEDVSGTCIDVAGLIL